MPVQKYTAREIARRNVQKKATGLTRDQVSEKTETARFMERHKGRGLDEPGRLDSLRLAEWAHIEWCRIGYVMAAEVMAVYAPEKDPRVAQWERQRLERVAAETAAAQQDGRGPATVKDVRPYRVVGQRLDDAHPGAVTITSFAEARSVEEAAQKVCRAHERDGGVYGGGLYRIVRVEEEQQDTDGELARLRAYVRAVLDGTAPHTGERRRALEALGEAGGLCAATVTHPVSGERVTCAMEAGHYAPDDDPEIRPEGDPGGWHMVDGWLWNDDDPTSKAHIDKFGVISVDGTEGDVS